MRKWIIPSLVLGSLMSSLYYLSVSNEMKYSQDIAFVLFGNRVSYISAYSAWFFGSFLLYGEIQDQSYKEGKTDLEIYFCKVHSWTLKVLGIIYILHYLEILTTNSKQRVTFLLTFIFFLSLQRIYYYIKKLYETWF